MEDMDLPEGKTCKDCVHFDRCHMLFQVKGSNTWCDFSPIKFVEADNE